MSEGSLTAECPARGRSADRRPQRRRFGVASLVMLLVVAVFLAVKIVFRLPGSSNTLYAYGIAVTAVAAAQLFVAFVLYRDPTDAPSGAAPPAAELSVTALVAVHNDMHVIETCIRSMVSQTLERLEIIVVDDASTDGTAEVLSRLAEELPITVITMPRNVGKKAALAAGILRSRGDILAFTDSDSTWAPDAVERCVRIFANDPRVGAVSGHCRAMNARHNTLTRVQDSWYEGQFSVRKAFESYFGGVTCVSGPLAVFRREAVYNYVPAWEHDRFLGDEFRFATDRMMTGFVLMDRRRAKSVRRLAADTPFATPEYPHRHWRAVYCKSAKSLTVVPETMRTLIRQQVRWKKSFIRNLFFTGSFYWRRPPLVALVYYLHVLFVLAGPLVAFRHIVYLPMHGRIESMILYLLGILLIGFIFGMAFRIEDPENREYWWYRPLMSLLSTLLLTWLIAYSLCTIKKMTWHRG